MPARDCPAACHSGALGTRRVTHPRGHIGPAREHTGRQVFRIPDFQTPTHQPRAALTPPERRRIAPRESGDLETWEPGDLPGAPGAPSERTINAD
jgi:hypothetical protein